MFDAKAGQRSFLIGIGLYEDDVPNRWLVFIDSQLGSVKRVLFGQADQAKHLTVCEAINWVLKSEPKISDIRWYSKANFDSGVEDDWRRSP